MKIEIHAGGFGGATINAFQSDFSAFRTKSENVISSFKAVKRQAANTSGGVGNLQTGVNQLQARISQEERKLEAVKKAETKAKDFVELANRVDKQVASLVKKNKEEFYQKYPHLKPADTSEEKAWYEQAWDWLCGKGEDLVGGVKNALKDFAGAVKEGWDWVCDSAVKLWNSAVAFYEEHKDVFEIIGKVILTAVIVIGAVAAIVATLGAGLYVLAPILAAIGFSASTAAAISAVVVVTAVVSTAGAAILDTIDVWAEIDHPVFNFFQTTLNIVSFITMLPIAFGNAYNVSNNINVNFGFELKDEAAKSVKTALEKATQNGTTNPWYLKNIVPEGVDNTFKGKNFVDTIKHLFTPDDLKDGIVKGFKYQFTDENGKKVLIKWHSLDYKALKNFGPSGGGAGWTTQLSIGKDFLLPSGGIISWTRNLADDAIRAAIHIPITGNPFWWIK